MADLPRTPSVELRAFRDADRDGLIQLWTVSELLRPWNEPNRDIDTKVDHDPQGLLVLVERDRVIGSVMAGFDGHRGWVNYLAVHPDRRSRGFGNKLMTAAEEHLAAQGCQKVNLQIRTANNGVVSFYRSLGFELDDVVSMGKRLSEADAD